MDAAVLPPTLDHVRVSTPPRSIRLDEHAFPSATDNESGSTPTFDADRRMDEVEETGTPSRRRGKGNSGKKREQFGGSRTRASTEASDPQLKVGFLLIFLTNI